MGIAVGALEFLMNEGIARPWSGRVLTLGRQDTSVSGSDLCRVAAEHSVTLSPSVHRLANQSTALTDRQLFHALGFSSLSALDASLYEGADIAHDLNKREVPAGCERAFDLVFDGGTLEHVFDVAAALSVVAGMTAAGGRVVHLSPFWNCVVHGFYSFSPTFFSDFYLANGWLIKRIAVARFDNDPATDPWTLTDYRPGDFSRLGSLDAGTYFLLTCVQSTERSTGTVVPQQSYYRTAWEPEPSNQQAGIV